MKTRLYFSLALLFIVACSGRHNRRDGSDLTSSDTDSNSRVFALIIGVSEYDDRNIEELSYAHKDAQAFSNFLLQQVGTGGEVAIRLLKDDRASKSKIMTQIDWLYQNVRKGDQVYFYFSGHGMVHSGESAFSGAYLCAHDTYRASLADGGLEMNLIVNTLNKFVTEKGAQVYFIADACRAGSAQQSYSTKMMEVATADGKSPEMVRFLSCGENQESLEGVKWGGGRGLFSYYLELGLSGEADTDQDETITVHELEMYLKQVIPLESQKEGGLQIPEVLGNKMSLMNTRPGNGVELKGPPLDCGVHIQEAINQMIEAYLVAAEVGDPSDFFDEKIKKLSKNLDTAQNCNPELVLLEYVRQSNNELFHQYTTGKVINTGNDRFLKAAKLAKYALDKYKQRNSAPMLLEMLQEHHYFFLARSYAKRELPEQIELALHYLDELQLKHPSSSIIYINHLYAMAYQKMGNGKKAKQYYRKAILKNPNWAFPLVNLASMYNAEGNIDAASRLLDSAIGIDARFASAYYVKGLILQEGHDSKAAQKFYRKALALDAEHYGAANNLARVLEQEDFHINKKEIIRLYRQSIEADPYYLDAWCNLGLIYTKLDSAEKAIRLLQQALAYNDYQGDIEMRATQASVNDYLAYAHEKKGDLESAESYLHKSVQLSDGRAEAYAFLLINLLEQAKDVKALDAYEEGLRRHKDASFLQEWAAQSPELRDFLESKEVLEINTKVLQK